MGGSSSYPPIARRRRGSSRAQRSSRATISASLRIAPATSCSMEELDNSSAPEARTVPHNVNFRLARDWEIRELERKEQREAQRKRQAMPFPIVK
jgi:hypothetical protein